MPKQRLQQKQKFNLTPQQIQFLSLLQIPLSSLNSRIQEELEENPALEESEKAEDISIDQIEEENTSSYKYRQNNNAEYSEIQISESEETLSNHQSVTFGNDLLPLHLKPLTPASAAQPGAVRPGS